MKKRINKVFIACSGLGNINRGYETFAKECFDNLRNVSSGVNFFLIKGGGTSQENVYVVPNLKRRGGLAYFIGRIINKEGYWIEQVTFFIGMIPLILIKKPNVIFYSDFILGTFLWHFKKVFKLRYKLLFSNGSPNGAPFKTEDHVQQLLPYYLNEAMQKGEPLSKFTLLPYGFKIDLKKRYCDIDKIGDLKKKLGFDLNQKIILSVGAINLHHKRMDYLINEFANLPDDFFLIMIGQVEAESEKVIQLAEEKIRGRYKMFTLKYEELINYYIISDFFVLCSLNEGFGRVLVEASSYGLKCIVHHSEMFKELLDDNAIYVNMNNHYELTSAILNAPLLYNKNKLIEFSYNNYSWDILSKLYIEMFNKLDCI